MYEHLSDMWLSVLEIGTAQLLCYTNCATTTIGGPKAIMYSVNEA